MFVRRKINKSGSISIYVVDKSRGRYDVVKSFGTAKTAAEADLLENRAREFVREQTGEPDTLFGGMTEAQLRDYASTLDQGRIELAGPELLYGGIFDRLGLGEGRDTLFRHLVICRLFNPGSKRRVVDYVRQYLGTSIEVKPVYDLIDRLHLSDIVIGTEEDAAGATCFLFPLEQEASGKADGKELAKSRGPRPRVPQIQVALLQSADGKPLGCRMYEASMPAKKRNASLKRFFTQCHADNPPVVPYEARDLPHAFRINRMDLKVRPYNRRLKGRIEGHLCVSLAAYAVEVELQRMLRASDSAFTLAQIRDAARTMFRLNYISPYTRRPKSVLAQPTPLQRQILDFIHQD